MIEEQAVVARTEGAYAWAEIQRKSVCGHCDARKGCGTAALGQLFGHKQSLIRVKNPLGSQAGDWVVLGLDEGSLVRGALLVYLLPVLALLLAGGLVQWMFAPPEAIVIVCGLLGFAASFFGLRRWMGKFEQSGRFQPVMLRQVTQPAMPVSFQPIKDTALGRQQSQRVTPPKTR